MNTEFVVENQYGETWIIRRRESDKLTSIGGVLMTHGKHGFITMSAHLTETEKHQGYSILCTYVSTLQFGKSGTMIWCPDVAMIG